MTSASSSPSWPLTVARGRCGIRSRSRRSTTRPVTWGTRRASGASPGTSSARSRAGAGEAPADPGTCCGSAGVYNLLQPEAAGELGARKAASVLATGAPLVISANPGCSLQISAAMAAAGSQSPPAMAHIAEVLDASLRGAPVSELTGRGQGGQPGPGNHGRPRLAAGQPVRVEFPLGHDHRGPGQPAGPGLQRHQQLATRHRDVPPAGVGFRCGE